MSVFHPFLPLHPLNPRTQLPSDSMERNMDLSHTPTSQIHTRASGPKPLESLHVATSPRLLDCSRMHDSQKWNLVGQPAVLPNSEDLSTGNERTNPVSDYSTLFSALLESNALLHKEIHELHEQHQKNPDHSGEPLSAATAVENRGTAHDCKHSGWLWSEWQQKRCKGCC